MANLNTWEIRLNPILLAENEAEFFREVIPHELSHLIVHQIFGRVRPHGREWQNIMRRVFEVEPETRHNYDTSSLPGQSFRYQCSCQTFELTIRRHNKVQRKQATYQCQTCHQPLVWLGE